MGHSPANPGTTTTTNLGSKPSNAKVMGDYHTHGKNGKPYQWNPTSNNSNDWINRRLEEAGGKKMLNWRGRWLK